MPWSKAKRWDGPVAIETIDQALSFTHGRAALHAQMGHVHVIQQTRQEIETIGPHGENENAMSLAHQFGQQFPEAHKLGRSK